MDENKKILYLDMDGVLANFKSSYLKMKSEHPEITYPQSQFGFFNDMEPIDGAIEAFKKLNEIFDVHILTRPSVYNLMCYTEKAYWIKKYLGFEMLYKLNLCPNKALMKGDYLIDDSTEFGQTEFEGELILFASEKFPDWDSVLKYLNIE